MAISCHGCKMTSRVLIVLLLVHFLYLYMILSVDVLRPVSSSIFELLYI